MPLYEFYCDPCHTLFTFFSSRVNTDTLPPCPRCGQGLQRQLSLFSAIGRAKEDDGGLPSAFAEERMERVVNDLAREAMGIDGEDPQQMARLMRRFSEQSGMNLGQGMEEALTRMEAGEDPETIDREMGDILESEDPFTLRTGKGRQGGKQQPAERDDRWYELEG